MASSKGQDKEIDDYIANKRGYWLEKLDLSNSILADLVKENVLTGLESETLKAITDPSKKRDDFITRLSRSSIDQFTTFCRILKRHNRGHLLKDLPPWVLSEYPQQGASNAPTDTKSTKASGEMTSQVPIDEAIKKLGKAIQTALYDNQVTLKSDAGLEMNAVSIDYVRQWKILSNANRSSLKELTKMSEKLAFVLSALERRPPVELVLFAKVLILTSQGHHLENIGLSLTEINAIDTTYCKDKCRSGHE